MTRRDTRWTTRLVLALAACLALSLSCSDEGDPAAQRRRRRKPKPRPVAKVDPARLAEAKEKAVRLRSASNLRIIAQRNKQWLAKQGKATTYPDSLQTLFDSEFIDKTKDVAVFLHPSNKDKAVAGQLQTDYEFMLDKAGFPLTRLMCPGSTMPLGWEKQSFAKDGGRNVVFFDSHVEYMTPEGFEQLMREMDSWITMNAPE